MPVNLKSFGRPTITFTSDFGWSSPGVGIMKGVALAICPQAQVIDITHEVKPFSTIEGACIMETVASLPPGGIHVCVVDPGVGSWRRLLAIKTRRGDHLVGPDNGVLLPAAERLGGIAAIASISNPAYLLEKVGTTFDGRDVMAPAAAAIANGVALTDLGAQIDADQIHLPAYEEAPWRDKTCKATVLHVNHYGSVYLNIDNTVFHEKGFARGKHVIVHVDDGREKEVQVSTAFSDVAKGESLLYEGHFGRVQCAVNQGSFARRLGLDIGSVLGIRLLH